MVERQKRIGDYVILQKIGKGGQATVYKGVGPDGSEVAIKKMSAGSNIDNQKSFEREIAILKLVKHEYLVKNLACFEENGYYYLVYEFCPIDLLHFIQKLPQKKVPETVVKKWIRQLNSVMVSLNNLKIIHRDLKPENILLTQDSIEADIRLGDFGLAKQGLSRPTFVGTLEYASPEIKNCQEYSYNTDVWSLGVIAFGSLTGKLPLMQGTELIFPQNIEISEDAKDFIKTCMTFSYRERPNFKDLINHNFIAEQKILSVEESSPDILVQSRLKKKDNIQEKIYELTTLCFGMLRDIKRENMEFIEYLVADYFTEKFTKLTNLILEVGDSNNELSYEFIENFFNQSEEACIISNKLEKTYKNSSIDDTQSFIFQIEEIINLRRESYAEGYLRVLFKIKNRLERNLNDLN